MAWTEDRRGYIPPGVQAASIILPFQPVALDTVEDQVVPIATNNVRPYGINGPATAAQGEAVTVYGEGCEVKAIAVASLGAGAEVGHASSNHALNAVTGASGITRYSVGQSRSAAGAGERFTLIVNPRQLSNLI